MKKRVLLGVTLFCVVTLCAAGSDTEQIVVVTKISVSSEEAERVMNLVLDDASALSEKYHNEKGIKDVAIDMENKTRMKRLRSAG